MSSGLSVLVSSRARLYGWLIVVAFVAASAIAFLYAFTDLETVAERRIGSVGVAVVGFGGVWMSCLFVHGMVRLSQQDGVLLQVANGVMTVTTVRGVKAVPTEELVDVRFDEKTKSVAISNRQGDVFRPMLRPEGGTWDGVVSSIRDTCGLDS